MIEVGSLYAGYGSVPVLHDVSLSVADGEILAVIGANGAGKTTLLRSISGIVRPRSGTIVMDGQDLTRMRASEGVRAGICHVPEGRHVFPDLSVEDNLRLGAYIHRRDSASTRRRMDEALNIVPQLASRLSDRAGALSGGQQQMLAIGRALMSGCKHLLMDEPSLGLSPSVTAAVFDTVRALRGAGRTIILVEQNGRMALEVADQGVVLANGTVAMSGAAAAVAADPEVAALYLGTGRPDQGVERSSGLVRRLEAVFK